MRVMSYTDFPLVNVRDRVVCVMTTGQEWQFKPYKWKEPKELFHHGVYSLLGCTQMVWRDTDLADPARVVAVKGIYPQWTSDPPNAKIRSWNVSELKVRSLYANSHFSILQN